MRRGFVHGLACLTIGAVLLLAACVPSSLRGGDTDVERAWRRTLHGANQAVLGGRYDDADSLLARFAASHAGSDLRYEAYFWRAIFLLDPGNRGASTEGGISLLDRYLSGRAALQRRREAVTLRRLAAELQTVRQVAAAHPVVQSEAPKPVAAVVEDRNRDDEVQRLKAELAKANEELERIRKRLTVKP